MTDTDFSSTIESDLAEALDGDAPPPRPEPEGGEQQRQPAENPFPRSDDRPRDEQGRFKAKEETPPEGAGPGEGEPGKQGKEAEAERREPPLKEWQPLWWKDEQHGDWGKVPEALRTKLEEREREAAQAITQHSTRAKEWEPVSQFFDQLDPQTGKPYAEQLQEAGITRQEYLQNLINLDISFRQDPTGSALWLLNNLGIDPAQLAEHAAGAGQGNGQADPRLISELQALRQKVSALENGQSNETRQQQFQHIAEWSRDKPYFDELRLTMAALAKTDPKATLDELYERAQYAHPTLRERILRDQRKREADRARQAGVSTRGAPQGSPAPNTQRLSLDEELSANYDEVYGGAI